MKVKLVGWLGVMQHNFDKPMLLFADGVVYEGMGPSQRVMRAPPQTTVGALRDEWGDDSVAKGVPRETPAWLYGGDDECTASFVVIEVDILGIA